MILRKTQRASSEVTDFTTLASAKAELKGAATVLFIAHQMPRGVSLDSIVRLGPDPAVLSNIAAESDGDHDHARRRP